MNSLWKELRPLSFRAVRALDRVGVTDLESLLEKRFTEEELLALPNVGPTTARSILKLINSKSTSDPINDPPVLSHSPLIPLLISWTLTRMTHVDLRQMFNDTSTPALTRIADALSETMGARQ